MKRMVRHVKQYPVLNWAIPIVGRAWRVIDRRRPGDEGLAQIMSSVHPSARKIVHAVEAARRGESELAGRVEAERVSLLGIGGPLDDGSLSESTEWDAGFTVDQVVRASKPPRQALLLHELARTVDCQNALEIGTNVGISSAYIASATKVRLVTLDGSHYRTRIARQLHTRLGLENVEIVLGPFDQTLPGVLEEIQLLDFAFIDGNHRLEATLDYFDQIVRRVRPGGMIVFDDIRWSSGMTKAWRKLRNDNRLSLTVDLSDMGVGVVRCSDEADERIGEFSSWLRGPGPLSRNP